MLIRFELLDEFSWQKVPHLCETLTSLHRTMSDLMWYCLISSDEAQFDALCDDDVCCLLDDLALDGDSESAANIANLARTPFYRVSRSMFYDAHNDEFDQHLRNHQHLGLVTPYRMTELEFRDSELVVNLSINHGKIGPLANRSRRRGGYQTFAAYPSSFTRV